MDTNNTVVGYGSDGNPIQNASVDAQNGSDQAQTPQQGGDTNVVPSNAPGASESVTAPSEHEIAARLRRLETVVGSLSGQMGSFMESVNGSVTANRSDSENLSSAIRGISERLESFNSNADRESRGPNVHQAIADLRAAVDGLVTAEGNRTEDVNALVRSVDERLSSFTSDLARTVESVRADNNTQVTSMVETVTSNVGGLSNRLDSVLARFDEVEAAVNAARSDATGGRRSRS